MVTAKQELIIKDHLYEKVVKTSQEIKFVCVINTNGRTLCMFNEDCLDIDSKKKEMLFMETALQTRMNKDFDDDLGRLRCNITERDDGSKYVSAPLSSNRMVFALMNKECDHDYFVNTVTKMQYLLN